MGTVYRKSSLAIVRGNFRRTREKNQPEAMKSAPTQQANIILRRDTPMETTSSDSESSDEINEVFSKNAVIKNFQESTVVQTLNDRDAEGGINL